MADDANPTANSNEYIIDLQRIIPPSLNHYFNSHEGYLDVERQ
jgi:hypothetical protein